MWEKNRVQTGATRRNSRVRTVPKAPSRKARGAPPINSCQHHRQPKQCSPCRSGPPARVGMGFRVGHPPRRRKAPLKRSLNGPPSGVGMGSKAGHPPLLSWACFPHGHVQYSRRIDRVWRTLPVGTGRCPSNSRVALSAITVRVRRPPHVRSTKVPRVIMMMFDRQRTDWQFCRAPPD
jgi:hypothetical protein